MREAILEFVKAFVGGATGVFAVYLILYSTFLFIGVIAGVVTLYYRNKKKRFENEVDSKYHITVTIVVPA